jgi:hypothetical protein
MVCASPSMASENTELEIKSRKGIPLHKSQLTYARSLYTIKTLLRVYQTSSMIFQKDLTSTGSMARFLKNPPAECIAEKYYRDKLPLYENLKIEYGGTPCDAICFENQVNK